MPAKNTKMVVSKKSVAGSKAKVGSATKVGSAKSKKPSGLSLSKINTKAKEKNSKKLNVKPPTKASPKKPAARRASQPPVKPVSKPAAKAVSSKPVSSKPASSTNSKASAPVAAARSVKPVVEQKPPEQIKRKEADKKSQSSLRSATLNALKIFEAGMKAFNRHNFTDAKNAFEQLLNKFADETEIAARVRMYLNICIQRLSPPKSPPRNLDALYNQGVIELNKGRIDKAIDMFERALKIQPQADFVFYSLAAAHARLGSASDALANLRRAIELDKLLRNRFKARRDPDFSQLYENPEFQELVGIETEHHPAEQQPQE